MIKSNITKKTITSDEEYYSVVSSEVANICLNCPLPAKNCDSMKCSRFNKEFKKIKKQGDNL